MQRRHLLVAGLAVLPPAVLLAGQVGLLRGASPTDLGVRNGRLRPPSPTPNSVHSQADLWPGHPQQAYARIDPLRLGPDRDTALARLRSVLLAHPGAELVHQAPDYLHVQFSTRWLRFVDDAEFWWDPAAQVVQLRSASRLGRRDFGANRARIEALRQALGG